MAELEEVVRGSCKSVSFKLVASDDPAEFEAAVDEKTKAIYVETIPHPKFVLSPLKQLVNLCQARHQSIAEPLIAGLGWRAPPLTVL